MDKDRIQADLDYVNRFIAGDKSVNMPIESSFDLKNLSKIAWSYIELTKARGETVKALQHQMFQLEKHFKIINKKVNPDYQYDEEDGMGASKYPEGKG